METTKKLAEFITATGFADLPPETIREAKLCFLDWLAVTMAGVHDPVTDSVFDVIRLVGGKPQATVLGRNTRTSVLNATLLNGMASHALDFDDTSVEFLGHPSVTLFPCLLALAEWKRKNGRDFLGAFVIGYEAGCRVALGATAIHYLAGWHGTSTIGHFSSAAGAAKLLNLTADQLVHALGTAGTQAAGLKVVFGTSCKPFHAGKAGFNGLLSVLLAQRGFTSADNILEAPNGFWNVFAADRQVDQALVDWGDTWHILKNNYKFHASCHGTHAPIEAVLALKRDHPLDPVEIRQVDIIVSAPMLEVAGKEKPARGLEGKFSIPYSVANALLSGDTGIAAFTDERVQDAETVALRDKVRVIAGDQVDLFEADVTIHAGGKIYRRKYNMLTQELAPEEKRELIHTKFRSLAGLSLGKKRSEEVIERADNLEDEGDMAAVVRLLQP